MPWVTAEAPSAKDLLPARRDVAPTFSPLSFLSVTVSADVRWGRADALSPSWQAIITTLHLGSVLPPPLPTSRQ